MKLLIPLICLLIAQGSYAAEEPADLLELRQGWEEARSEAQAKVDKLYFAELEELKKNFTKARNIAAALVVDNAIKGNQKADNEPEALTKMRQARDKSLKKALTPLDKKYWKELKKLKEDFVKEGYLAGVVAADTEIKKVLAAYKNPPKAEKQNAQAKADKIKGFEMEFVVIGNPNNEADDTGYGAVPYTYRIGKYEISEEMIDAYNKRSREAKINKNTRGADKPATSVRPHQAALFVNWLNTSQGHQAAYKFKNGNFEPWDKDDAWQLGGENLLRHKDAYYFLPSEDEWYKAAYYDPQTNDGEGHYWDYATGSDKLPTPVANGTDPYTAVHSQPEKTGPADITTAGGLSPYGTMAQSGNVSEFGESAFDGTSKCFEKRRFMRGACFGPGFWGQPHFMKSGSRDDTIFPGYAWALLGFRVAAVTE